MPSKIFVYSKSGQSKDLAERLSMRTGADVEDVKVNKYDWPLIGYVLAVRDGIKAAAPKIALPLQLPPSDETVIIVGPVWAGGACGPLNAIVDQLKSQNHPVALALTCGSPKQNADPISKLENRLGRSFKAVLKVPNPDEGSKKTDQNIDDFVAQILEPSVSIPA